MRLLYFNSDGTVGSVCVASDQIRTIYLSTLEAISFHFQLMGEIIGHVQFTSTDGEAPCRQTRLLNMFVCLVPGNPHTHTYTHNQCQFCFSDSDIWQYYRRAFKTWALRCYWFLVSFGSTSHRPLLSSLSHSVTVSPFYLSASIQCYYPYKWNFTSEH